RCSRCQPSIHAQHGESGAFSGNDTPEQQQDTRCGWSVLSSSSGRARGRLLLSSQRQTEVTGDEAGDEEELAAGSHVWDCSGELHNVKRRMRVEEVISS